MQNHSIFKAYDIRGIYPEEINKEIAYKIGFATVNFLLGETGKDKLKLVIGEDCRTSSPTLRGAVIDAMTKAGADVYYISECTTPLFYFSVNTLKTDGGIMVTASHNPSQYGGFKIVRSKSSPIGKETGLAEIRKLVEANSGLIKAPGTVEEVDLVSDYVNFVVEKSGVSSAPLKKLKLVVDAGNGMTSIVLNPLFEKLKINPIKLYFEIDCNFPNHSPDISKPEALNALKQKLSETKADLGIAFDGDGDRVFFVDEKGNIIKAEYILALLYEDKKGLFHNPKVVYDLRISKSVKEHLGSRGKKTRPGHSFIKFLMQENDADLGGELSGHFFFKEMEYAESSILAMLQVLKIISEKGKHITKLVESYQKYWHSGEINLEIRDMRQATLIFEKLKDKYKDGEIDETDGILIDYWNIKSAGQRWWFNIRASNTEPLLRLVVEAETKELMEKKVRELKSLISEID